MDVGAIEAPIYAQFDGRLEVALPGHQHDAARSPEHRRLIAEAFASRTRAEWTAVFEGTDACVTPVLGLTEAPGHPHLAARGTYVQTPAGPQPAPAPRFSRTPAAVRGTPRAPGQDTVAALTAWGFSDEEVAALLTAGAVVQSGSEEEVR